MAKIARLSLNQITIANWSVSQAVEGCVRHGIPSIALWRHKIEEAGLASCVRLVQDAGLHVSSVCRGGMFPSPTQAGRQKSLEDNYRAAEEAAALQADSLVMVVGASPRWASPMRARWLRTALPRWFLMLASMGLSSAWSRFIPCTRRIALCWSRSARRWNSRPPMLRRKSGSFLIFFISGGIRRCRLDCAGCGQNFRLSCLRLAGPLPDVLMGRGMMGDGVIDNRMLRLACGQGRVRRTDRSGDF